MNNKGLKKRFSPTSSFFGSPSGATTTSWCQARKLLVQPPPESAWYRVLVLALALILGVTLARAQAPGLLWTTNIGATLFAVDDQTNLYANAGGTIVTLNGAGVPLQTNAMCPLPGVVRRDRAGNFYFYGSFIGTQDFGGTSLTNRCWSDYSPDYYVAKYASNGSLQRATYGPGYDLCFHNLVVFDVLPDENGGCLLSYSLATPAPVGYVAHYDDLGTWAWSVFPVFSRSDSAYFVALGSLTLSNFYFLDFCYGQWAVRCDLAGNWQKVGAFALFPLDWDTTCRPVLDDQSRLFQLGRQGTGSDPILVKWGYSTNVVWSKLVPPLSKRLLARDAHSNVYISADDGMLAMLNTDGVLIWTNTFPQPTLSMIVDGAGNRFLSFTNGSFGRLQGDPAPVAPTITSPPQSQTVFVGDNVTLTVGVAGTPPFQYAWTLQGSVLSYATSSALNIPSAAGWAAGSYAAIVSNAVGSVTSAPALFRVKAVEFYQGNQLLTNGSYVFATPPTLTLRSAFPNGSSFYTLDGSAPSFASTRYVIPFIVSTSATVRGIGYSADFLQAEEADTVNVIVLTRHSLSVTSTGGGTVTVDPPGTSFVSTNIVTVTAVPAAGWSFIYWLGDASGSNPVLTVTMDRDKSLRAIFGTTLSTTAAGSGQVQLDPPGGVYAFGTVVRLTAVPQPGNYFGAWGNAASGNANPLYFTVTAPNPTVSSIFGATPAGQAALTVLINGHGKVSVQPPGNAYPLGQLVTLAATPDAGESFLNWSGDANGSQNPLSVSMSQDRTITANFSRHATLRANRAGLEGLTPAGFRFTLGSDRGLAWQILGSTNLSAWEVVGTVTNVWGEVQFTDPSAPSRAERLYRAWLQP